MRPLKVLLAILVILGAVGGGALMGLRGGRTKVGHLGEVKPGLLTVTNAAGISLYAARVAPGPHVIFFDTGLDPEGRPVDALLRALNAGRDDVTDVFLTHGHFDHIGGAAVLTKAHLHLGARDVPLATGQQGPDSLVATLLGKALSNPSLPAINAPITAAGVIPVGVDAAGAAKTVKAFPVPGHTAGSYAFVYDSVLFVGDIMIVKEGRLEPTPRLFDPHPDENKAAIRSLKTQLSNEAIDVVCTGHGGCTPKGLGRNLLDELISRL